MAEVSHSNIEFFLKMTAEEIADWISFYNEHLREKAQNLKRAQK